MRYLMRDGAPLTEGQWEQIDKAVVEEASRILVGRRFLTIKAAGAQTQTASVDKMDNISTAAADFWGRGDAEPIEVGQRRFIQLANIYSDFAISWRDVENEQGGGVQAARDAAVLCARKEDDLIFHGNAALGIEGLMNAQGINKLTISDWNEGENPVRDIANAIQLLVDQGNSGERVLVLSSDLYAKLHRIQPGTGMMEIDRMRSLVGKLFRSTILEKNTAVLVYCEPQNADLVIGQDLITAYMGNEKLDQIFRVMETAAPRIKRPGAIAVLQ